MQRSVTQKPVEKNVLKNKPKDSRWRQQTLPSYRPLFTAQFAWLVFLFQGVLFVLIGTLVLALDNAKEVVVDYTCCHQHPDDNNIDCWDNSTQFHSFTCTVPVKLEEEYEGDVMFQYGMKHFFQNNRLYIKSRNDVQLVGDLHSTYDCDKYATTMVDGKELPIAPCGLVANSMFNDTFKLYYYTQGDLLIPVPFSTERVIWSVERKRKYKNPKYDPKKNETLCDAFRGTAKPLDWQRPICELGNDEDGYGFENVDFIAWMKPAALPTFRKNYRSLKKIGQFVKGLPQGNYLLVLNYNYPILQVAGNQSRKYFIISKDGILGAKNNFLPIAFITFGSVSLLTVVFFLVIQMKNKKH
uniref:Cell cycle control protein 50A n=1 Tax=Syphacia muris TaxID=451379 RepID=A0A0N5AQQ0_9BILA